MQETSILFIGNSYTYFNDMPTAIFQKIAESAGYTVQVTAITKGGWTLEKHADPADEYGALVDAALRKNRYDYVILQEQSVRPASEPEKFYAAVRLLTEKIRANGATPILYATWGRKTGSKLLAEHGWTNGEMTKLLADAYRTIGEELSIPVAYAGLAFHDVYTHHGDTIDLYDPDRTHPSAIGSYLAALTIFARIFGVDPMTVPFAADLPKETAKILKTAAGNALPYPLFFRLYKSTQSGKGIR